MKRAPATDVPRDDELGQEPVVADRGRAHLESRGRGPKEELLEVRGLL